MGRRWTWLAAGSIALACGCALAEPSDRTAAPSAAMGAPPAGPAPPETLGEWARGARIFPGMGGFQRKITTASPEAQAYFDQGMRFLWAFNHDEATRSFAKAAALDPGCASCYWGVALTLGPNYNMPAMAEPRGRIGWQALQQAKAHRLAASPVEQALISALERRYAGPAPKDPAWSVAALPAYAAAMKTVAVRFPADLDVQTLYAEALMNENPWKLWRADGAPGENTIEIVGKLETVLAKDPLHPGANHYLIHALEASPHPEAALAAARRLPMLMPAAGHIQHMPAHIYQRIGRYEDAADANRRGARADAAYYAITAPPDYYPMYTAHNLQFLAFSTAMEGRKAETMQAVREARASLPNEMLAGMPGIDWLAAYLYQAQIRFGMWDEILAERAPDAKFPGLIVGYLEARAMALAARGRIGEAKFVTRRLQQQVAATTADAPAGNNSAKAIYAVAALEAQSAVAQAEHDFGAASNLLREAVRQEDQLAYNEPADTFFPARHLLGAALMKAGHPAEAEAVYLEDLKHNPENGWALRGLALSLAAQGRAREAAAARERLALAWNLADVRPVSSAY